MSRKNSKKIQPKKSFIAQNKSAIVFLSLIALLYVVKLLVSERTNFEDYFPYIIQYSTVGLRQDLFMGSIVSLFSGFVSERDAAFFSAFFVLISLMIMSYFLVKTHEKYSEKSTYTKAIYFFVLFLLLIAYLNKLNLDSSLIIGVVSMIVLMKNDSTKFLIPIFSVFAVMTKLSYFYSYFIIVLISMFLIFAKEKSPKIIKKNKIISAVTISLTALIFVSLSFLTSPLSDEQITDMQGKLFFKTSVFLDKERFSFVYGKSFVEKIRELRITDFADRFWGVLTTFLPALALIFTAIIFYGLIIKKSKNKSVKAVSIFSILIPFLSFAVALFFKISIVSTVCFTLFYLFSMIIVLTHFTDNRIFKWLNEFTNRHVFFSILVMIASCGIFLFSNSIFSVQFLQFFENWWMPY